MELRHLRYFVLVAEELHFGRAAARAGIAQPPLSQQIRALEAELGVRLFNRTRRRVELTDAGLALLPEARETLRRAELAAQAAREGALGTTGHLGIGFVGSAAFGFLPQFVASLRKRYPDMRISLQELTSEQQRAALREGAIGVGLVRYPVLDPEIEHVELFTEPLVAAIPTGHVLAEETEPISIESLARERFVMFPRRYGPPFFDQIMALCRQAGFTPEIVQEAIQMPTIVSIVSAGIGVAIVPASTRQLRLPGVTFRALDDASGAPAGTSIYAVWHSASTSAVLANAIDVARVVAENR